MILELLAIYVIKDTVEKINKRLEEEQKRKAKQQRKTRRAK